MITRPSCAVGKYGTIEFLGRSGGEGSFIFELERTQRLPYPHVKNVLNEFSEDWIQLGINEHFNLVFVLKVQLEPGSNPGFGLQINLENIARKLTEKLNTIGPQIMMARQMADTEIVSEPVSP